MATATTKVRFAPSPTGRLHLGNARAALVNWLFSRKTGGVFLLRLDDTDVERSTAEYAAAIEADLRWLGLDWDEFARQSDRLARYEEAAERLKRAGRLYPCFETPEELDLKRKLAQARGRAYVYDRAALALSEEERGRRIAAGERPHWRFKLDHRRIAWVDLVRGPVEFDAANLSDPVLIRADGLPLYTLSSVVDDVDLSVTHVIRGEDHVTNTAVQIELFTALDGEVPSFAHLSLIADAGGEMLSKRLGSLGIADLADAGIEPMAVNSLLAKLGTSDPIEPRTDLGVLADEFDLSKFGRAQPRFDMAELRALNAKLLHVMPFQNAASRLPAGADPAFWEAVRANLGAVAEANVWWQVCRGEIRPVIEDPALLREAAALLPPEPFDAATWRTWTGAIKAKTGHKGKALFLPLRLALTGRDHGPELQSLLPLIGREKALKRLAGETA
ncbi:MAG TPA: glutamate--tRNA ligase [Stellaceae bacterium]